MARYVDVSEVAFAFLVVSVLLALGAIVVSAAGISGESRCEPGAPNEQAVSIGSIVFSVIAYFILTFVYMLLVCCTRASRPRRLRVRSTYPPVFTFVGVLFLSSWLTTSISSVLECGDAGSITLFVFALLETAARIIALVAQQEYTNELDDAAQ